MTLNTTPLSDSRLGVLVAESLTGLPDAPVPSCNSMQLVMTNLQPRIQRVETS